MSTIIALFLASLQPHHKAVVDYNPRINLFVDNKMTPSLGRVIEIEPSGNWKCTWRTQTGQPARNVVVQRTGRLTGDEVTIIKMATKLYGFDKMPENLHPGKAPISSQPIRLYVGCKAVRFDGVGPDVKVSYGLNVRNMGSKTADKNLVMFGLIVEKIEHLTIKEK